MVSIRSRPSRAVCLLLLATAVGCERPDRPEPDRATPDEPAAVPVPAELRHAKERFVRAWNDDDPSAVAAFYTDDATATAAGHAVQGRQAIEQAWLTNVPFLSNLSLTEDSVRPVGDDFRDAGQFSVTVTLADAEPVEQVGRYALVWTREPDGDWRVRASEVRPRADDPG